MGSLELLRGADSRLMGLVSTLAASDLERPSPCSGWSVRSMLSHTVATIDAFATAVDGLGGPTEAELFSGSDILGSNWQGVAEQSINRSQRAWATVTDWDKPVTTLLGSMPAGQAIGIVTYSTLIHSWDLAAAIDQPVEFDASEVALAEAVGSQLVPGGRPGGLFGPEVALGADASPTQRVVAFAGRNPL
ncbi:TIGR03086 family metal-binding protein [Candidatus Mycolicibacterium alkanivorans]|uniref:TIGR03086 family protein n=1 Tax=Candidatus Mycolicibacterium alkanivorans TaxID=2954114 RepID=A0ABS9YYR4_9MYCO|nr:TIGR03086 family metal-binding protein [Candidatus Mycolicibacterium alkanivorans]MCI4676350.1 TIGR03086 family protein [Candidatus Mycolicibacterium alkanivorans]